MKYVGRMMCLESVEYGSMLRERCQGCDSERERTRYDSLGCFLSEETLGLKDRI